jgi:glycosyltransferase involved in cell wall biosynthesis
MWPVSASDPTKACCCLVVGMHNSGTSLVGALLHAAGVPMGDRLLLRETIEPERRPRYDYFEDEDVVALQDATLLELQRHWSSYRSSLPLPPATSEARQRFRERLKTLVQRRLRRQKLWVVKDPRTAVLLDDWLRVLGSLQVELKLLIVHRSPIGNIRSFSSKGQVPPLWAEALWQRTYTQALDAAATLPAHQVGSTRFEALLSDAEGEAHRLCTFLNWTPPADLKQRVQARFDPSLPTEQSGSAALHPATVELEERLAQLPCVAAEPLEPPLLAEALSTATASQQTALELNALHPGGQQLLPKARVTIVTAELQGWGPSGGIGSAYGQLAVALTEAGHPVRVVLVAPGHDEPATPLRHGLTVERLDPSGLPRLELCRRVTEAVGRDPGDVVHLHDWLGLGSGLRQALGPQGPPLIVGLHGPSAWTRGGNPWPQSAEEDSLYAEGVVRALEEDAIRHADLLLAPSRFMAGWVHQHLLAGAERPPIHVQRNCPLQHGRPQSDGQAKTNGLVYFGRLEQRKGLLLFLAALAQMDRKPEQVVFVGGDCRVGEGRWGSDLAREQLQRLGITAEFHHSLRQQEALELLLELAGVVVIPSLIENSPCVVEELLGSGLRLVVTDVGGTAELVAEASRRWLCPPEANALAARLAEALSSSEPEAFRLKAKRPGWQISLSWQAFHERLPKREEAIEPTDTPPAGLIRRGLRLAKRVARKLAGPALHRLRQ